MLNGQIKIQIFIDQDVVHCADGVETKNDVMSRYLCVPCDFGRCIINTVFDHSVLAERVSRSFNKWRGVLLSLIIRNTSRPFVRSSDNNNVPDGRRF